MDPILQADFALTQPVLPLKSPAVLDVLLTFRVERPAGGAAPRLPLNLSLVLDRSGSMSGKPLRQALAAAEVLVKLLEPRDTLSVVAYDDKVATVVPPQKVTAPAAVCAAIRKVRTGGTTNLHGGWMQGVKHVLSLTGERALQRVLLLTDG